MTALSKIQSLSELNTHMDELTNVLSRAFYDDPYYIHIMPSDKKRTAQIQWWMRILLRYTQKNGSIFVTSDYKGVALWFGPDRPTLNNVQLALLGLIFYPVKVGIKSFFNMLDVSTQWEKEHAKQNNRHYYLMIIGVDPSLQRKGIGSQLIRDTLLKADVEKLDCYLETATKENVMFYKKHGFEIIQEKDFGINSQYWLMKRTSK
jgi:ribosomal protein S18 acetylase RimI-like enzyme